jgi:hypothetical protein
MQTAFKSMGFFTGLSHIHCPTLAEASDSEHKTYCIEVWQNICTSQEKGSFSGDKETLGIVSGWFPGSLLSTRLPNN